MLGLGLSLTSRAALRSAGALIHPLFAKDFLASPALPSGLTHSRAGNAMQFDSTGRLPGLWARIRVNGDRNELPALPANGGLMAYRMQPIVQDGAPVWTSDGVTEAQEYIGQIGVIA